MYNHLYQYYVKHEFLLMSPTLIHDRIDGFSLFPLLICKFPLQQREKWHLPSAMDLLSCSVSGYLDGSIRVVDLYPVGNNFIN